MASQLEQQGVAAPVAQQVAQAPPVASLFAAFLGYNPMSKLVPADVLHSLPQHNQDVITGQSFFPHLISGPFMHGLKIAFTFSLILFLLAAIASWLRGGRYVHEEHGGDDAMTQRDETEALEEATGTYRTVLQEQEVYSGKND
jgi:hypothetical protein